MDERTKRLLDAALGRGWITPEQVDECLKIQETVKEVGVEQPVEEILVKKGYLTADRVQELSRTLAARQIGKYQILEKLGEGGAGIVYRAKQEPLDRTVAIKILSKNRAESKEYLDRFRREARVAVTLNHENIVRGLDYGEADGYHYFVMEYVAGEALNLVLKREGSLEEKRAFEIALQTVQALIHAAEYDLVHRDIKPENILLTPFGAAKLCDLGLAKPSLVDTGSASRDGTTIGTPHYMSPEQIKGRDDTDFRADVYSLGVTLYHLVAGRTPFTGTTPEDVVRKHLNDTPTDPREFCLGLSSGAAAVILKMIAKRPEKRYAALSSLAEDLQAVLDGRPPRHTVQVGGQRPTGKVRIDLEDGAGPRRARIEAKKKMSPVLFAVVGLVVAGVAVAAFLLSGSKTPEKTDKVKGGPTEVPEQPSTTDKPVQLDPGEKMYRTAVAYVAANPDASFEVKRKRFEAIIEQYPGTPWERTAKDRLLELTNEEAAAGAEHVKQAELTYKAVTRTSATHRAALHHGEALKALDTWPEKYGDTEFDERVAGLRKAIGDEAVAKTEEALNQADEKLGQGYYDEAGALLEPLSEIGVPELESRISEKLTEIDAAKASESASRQHGMSRFKAVLGAAYSRAAAGEYREAEDDLVNAGGEEVLAFFRRDLDAAWRDLREARRFHDALRGGVESWVGKIEEFLLESEHGRKVSGKITTTTGDGFRMRAGTMEVAVKFRGLGAEGLGRLAFLTLDKENGADRRAAAQYFLMQGMFDAADPEIEAARIRGEKVGLLRDRLKLLDGYLRKRVEPEITKADRFLKQARGPEAIRLLESAALQAPAYGRVRYRLGVALVESGRNEHALFQLTRATALGEEDPEVHFHCGRSLQALKRKPEAAASLRLYLAEAGDSAPNAEDAKARIRSIEGNSDEKELKKLEDDAKDAFRHRNWEKAAQLYRQLLASAPGMTDCYYYIGKAEVEQDHVYEGYVAYARYLDAQPSGRRAGPVKREIRSLERSYAGNDKSRKAFDAGLAEFVQENYESAVDQFGEALKVAPLDGKAYYQRGLAHLRLGQFEAKAGSYKLALGDFMRAVVLKPDDPLPVEGLALCQYHLSDYDAALENAQSVIKRRPEGWVAYHVAGLVYLVRRDYLKALNRFSDGIRKAPGEAALFLNRALAYEGLERISDARTDLETAKRKKPTREQEEEIRRIEERLAAAEKGD